MSEYLYHVTSASGALHAMEVGLPQNVALATVGVAIYQARQMTRSGDQPAILQVPKMLVRDLLRPDGLAIISPADNGMAASDSEVFEAWAVSAGTAEDCLAIVGSARCSVRVRSEHLGFVSLEALETDAAAPAGRMPEVLPRRGMLSWILGRLRATQLHMA